MARTVFILGAGASADAGAPLMADFLDRADQLYEENLADLGNGAEAFETVRRVNADLQVVHAKSYLQLDNIETLFSAIEMGRLIGRLPGGLTKADDIDRVRDALVTVIFKTLELSMSFNVDKGRVMPSRSYGHLAKLLTEVGGGDGSGLRDTAILTFNYDVGLDHALEFNKIPFTYCLPATEATEDSGKLPLLKLHGSINWGVCPKCSMVVPFELGEAGHSLWQDTKIAFYEPGTRLHERQHCEPLSGPPVIVPPTWDKTQYRGQLGQIWARAATELSMADRILVIGYSLPETDSFFRYLFALGTQGDTRIKRLSVINTDQTESFRQRFRDMIGRGIENRLEFVPRDFQQSIGTIKERIS